MPPIVTPNTNINHYPILPWQPSVFALSIQKELDRRKKVRSFNYIDNTKGDWSNIEDGDWKNYKGPLTSFIRLCSNGRGKQTSTNTNVYDVDIGQPEYNRQRFILYSGKGFYQTYGFAPPTTPSGLKYQVIGYTPGNKDGGGIVPHTIENDLTRPSDQSSNYPIHVPSPEISRMEVTVQKELFRRATVEWACFSWKQLEYMTPYFLVPGITCMLEWGWNHYNINSLVNLGDTALMRQLWDNAYPLYTNNILDSCGNYDVLYGIISNFNWSIEGNKIVCTTEITSKDRLYAGISNEFGMSVKQSDPKNVNTGGIFRSIKDFINNNNNLLNLKKIVTTFPILNINSLGNVTRQSDDQDPNRNNTWYDILSPLLIGNVDQVGMQAPYVFGYFDGRPNDNDKTKPDYPNYTYSNWGEPTQYDFDKNLPTNDLEHTWINMGLVVRFLNYFSTSDSGAKQGKSMFEVDIQNSIICGHPNLISCDQRVLIPNHIAPKFLYGAVGGTDNYAQNPNKTDNPANYPYAYQVLRPLTFISGSLPDQTMTNVLYQNGNVVYRDDLDSIINYNRYRFTQVSSKQNINFSVDHYCFPAKSADILPDSPYGLKGNQLEPYYSGLLSNIYISYATLSDAVNNESNSSYKDIYEEILKVLMDSTDGFWDLSLVDVDGVMTITDRNFIGKYAISQQGDSVYSFDYYDADSIIKSIKFRPVMSDAQTTRVMYGNVNNQNAKYTYVDKNDLLNFQFKDAIIRPSTSEGDSSVLNTRKTSDVQHRDLLRTVQQINQGDNSLQMTLNPNRKVVNPQSSIPVNVIFGPYEFIKLILPNKELLKLLMNDNDFDNNPRYCAVQPGIILELTIQGIGGLRTFQYFTVKNFPEPYSDRNIIFRITEVHQTVEMGNWETTIRAQPTPLRGYITKRLSGPYGSNENNGWPPQTNQR